MGYIQQRVLYSGREASARSAEKMEATIISIVHKHSVPCGARTLSLTLALTLSPFAPVRTASRGLSGIAPGTVLGRRQVIRDS